MSRKTRFKNKYEFIKFANSIHESYYSYDKVEAYYGGNKITITCPVHGDFTQTIDNHIRGKGCYDCGRLTQSKNNKSSRLENKYKDLIQPDEYKLIPLTKGAFSKVDNDDFDRLKDINWSYSKRGDASNNKFGKMHRFITNCPEDMVVDHINRDPLDNRKINLRICTQKENTRNSTPVKNSSSKYKGVLWDKRRSKWRSSITHEGKTLYLGRYECEIEAAKAYDKKAKELHKEFAYLNFPQSN